MAAALQREPPQVDINEIAQTLKALETARQNQQTAAEMLADANRELTRIRKLLEPYADMWLTVKDALPPHGSKNGTYHKKYRIDNGVDIINPINAIGGRCTPNQYARSQGITIHAAKTRLRKAFLQGLLTRAGKRGHLVYNVSTRELI